MDFWQAVAFLPTDEPLELARAAEDVGFHGIDAGFGTPRIHHRRAYTASWPCSTKAPPPAPRAVPSESFATPP